ncbi:Uncharacterised protein (plasmid) [Tsukamurella tyrosinosolvens]|uniref:Penicillinase repressor n=1 Tax=Tsukamurella tyrosinosolvens TaxID=57704 RepID=A0A1H4V2B1_TSUTY|nr:hypothetical protein [Tsukamurella tyrosinosolvens]SEC75043.1 hypothetical protein SAMN04489793_3115 [Tsukamurella tyrosinosolvens]VEH90734.1 Uncharacterised protein [Tsukamurella tyrosinosolvens]
MTREPLTTFDRAVLEVIKEHGSLDWHALVDTVIARCEDGTIAAPTKSFLSEIRRTLRRLHEQGEVRSELAGLTTPGGQR